jgi:hypothetical protein
VDVLELEDERRVRRGALEDVDEPVEQPGLGEARWLGPGRVDVGGPAHFRDDAGEN